MKNLEKTTEVETSKTSGVEKKKSWKIRRIAAALRRKNAAKRRQNVTITKNSKMKKPKKIINRIKNVKKSQIIDQINSTVMSEGHKDYQSWEIGTTKKPILRKKQYSHNGENIQFWKQWHTESIQDAQDIKKYFTGKKMKSNIAKEIDSRYVYIV